MHDADAFYGAFGNFLDQHGVKHFRAIELCRVGRLANGVGPALKPPPRRLWANILPTLRVADWLRDRVGPVHVSSGYRDPAYNAAVNGGDTSLHMSFNAMDLVPSQVRPAEFYGHHVRHSPVIEAMGVGTYDSFIHIDTRWFLYRTSPARW